MSFSTQSTYGHFNETGDEYIITRFDTPKPWMNYIWNRNIHSGVDQRGRGETIYRNLSGERTNMIKDRIVYIKDRDTGRIWTIGWDPIQLDFSHYTCSHGLGYTKLEMLEDGLRSTFTVTTAADDPIELWRITVTNEGDTVRRVSVYPYTEFDLGGFDVYGGLENNVISKLWKDSNTMLAINNSRSRLGTKNNCFFACDGNPAGFETSKIKFLGGRYGNLSNPAGVLADNIGCFAGANEAQVGVAQYDYELQPGQKVEIHAAIGPFENEDEIEPLRVRSLTPGCFDDSIAAWKVKNACFANLQLDLKDEYLNPLLNDWTKHQLSMMMDWSRGWTMGFRDTLQDAQAFCSLDSSRAKTAIILACKHQLNEGMALRGYWPIDSNPYADGGVWLAYAVVEYIKETGDFAILDESVDYYDTGSATVWEHLKQGLDWIYKNPGKHGLTRMQFGDWNDSLNIGIGGEGESVWLSIALVVAARQTAELAAIIGEQDTNAHYTELADKLQTIIEQECWDGEWYLRGYTDDGSKVGSHECKEGMMFSETQAWSIMAGLTPERWDTVEDSIQKHLMTDYGMIVCTPAFKTYDKRFGRISTLPPGWGENASSYCHVSAFKAVADCVRGDGDAALETLTRILAVNPKHPIELSGAEPYGFTNMFRGPENPWAGLSLRSWYTGTTGWVFRCITQYMLGVKPTYEGLLIDPVLPKSWDSVKMHRIFRGSTYDITISTSSEAKGITVELDGKPLDGNLIPIDKNKGHHSVVVECGIQKTKL